MTRQPLGRTVDWLARSWVAGPSGTGKSSAATGLATPEGEKPRRVGFGWREPTSLGYYILVARQAKRLVH